MINRMMDAWLGFVIGRPKLVLALICCLLVLAGIGLPRFKLDASADSLTLETDRDLDYFREISKQYGSGDFLVVTFTPEAPLFSEQALATLERLHNDLAQVEGIASVNSILNVPLLYSPRRTLREITEEPRTLRTPGVDWEQAKEEFLTSPIYRDLILSPDGQTTALQLNIAVDERYIQLVQTRDALRDKRRDQGLSSEEQQTLREVSATFLAYRTEADAQARERVQQVRDVVAQYRNGAEIHVGGVSMIAADMIAFIQQDLVVFGAAVLLFMVLVLAVIFRSLRFVVIPMATCLSALWIMLGLISWLDWRLTVISSNFVALLLIISLAIIIHLIVRYREYSAENPDWTQAQLVHATLRFMAKPCLYTALTSVVAFVSLVISDIRPVIDFGWMMTIGLLFALVLAFALLPACLMLVSREPSVAPAQVAKNSRPLTLYCSAFVEKYGYVVLIGAVLLGALALMGLRQLQVENQFINNFHKDTEIYQGLSVIDNQLGGTTSLDIVIQAPALRAFAQDEQPMAFGGGDDPFAEEEGLDGDPFATVAQEPGTAVDDAFADDGFGDEDAFGGDAFADEGFGDDGFGEGDAFSDPAPRDRASVWMTVSGLQELERIHDYLEARPEIGKVQSLAILYKVGRDIAGGFNNFELAVMERSLGDDIREVLLDPFLSGAEETRITMRVKDSYPGLQRAELVREIHQHLQQEFNLNMEHVRFSGLLVLYNNMLQSLFQSQIATLAAVFIGIMLMFMVLFRSFLVALVAIIPTALAALSVLGGMGLFGVPLDMMTITVAAIAVGIGVDNTIHYVYRFRKEVTVDGDYVAAMHRSHGSIGRAMFYTSVIIVFGFSIMVLSRFIPTIYFGLFTGYAMFAALLGALLLLPKLLIMVKPFKVAKAPD